ncbi:MAG: BACON domain-containing protein [Synergistaceae bacterium]|nr:BACON domain-containing protein [Synergistaceae bacterium]
MTDSRLINSDLTPYLTGKITEKLDLADIEGAISVIESLTSRDMIFFSDADKNIPEENSGLFYESLINAHKNGVILAAVYPDSADIDAIETLLSEYHNNCLSEPVVDAKDPHFEIIAAALRYLPDGMPHTFVYVDDSDTNYGEMLDFQELSDDLLIKSPDIYSNDISISGDHTGDDSDNITPLTPEEIEADLHISRVENLFIWANSLDSEIQSAADDMRTLTAKLKTAANTTEDIQKLVTGLTTTKADNVSWSFADYYNKFGKNNNNFKVFADKCDFDNERLLNKYWSGFKISRNTFSQYRAISFHSFKNHCDYFLIMSRANTQPQSLVIAADEGTYTRKEIPGSGAYNYAVILGATSGLFTSIERVYKFGDHVYYMPDQTVNKNKSYTDTKGWSLTGGVSFKGGTQNNALAADATSSFSASVSHTSATTWQGQDYEVIPKPNGSWLARWLLDVDYPGFADGGWIISTAAKSSVTLRTESIWASTSRNFMIKGRALWYEGFAWCHDSWILGYPKYWCAVTHSGNFVNITLPRPPRIALTDNSTDGGKEGKLYSTKLYTDENWTAKADVNWIELESTSGGQVAGVDFYYTVTPNNTGKTRTGYITIQAGKDKAVLKFVQSAY